MQRFTLIGEKKEKQKALLDEMEKNYKNKTPRMEKEE